MERDVIVNVYDLWSEANDVLWMGGLGFYHSGIQVGGKEYAYGFHGKPTSGIYHSEPKNVPNATFREALLIGKTKKTSKEVETILQDLGEEFTGVAYHVVYRNCNHFSEQFVRRLCDNPFPSYINRFAGMAWYIPSCVMPSILAPETTCARIDGGLPSNDSPTLISGGPSLGRCKKGGEKVFVGAGNRLGGGNTM
eukprot:Rmarinus@m.20381